MDNVRQYIDLIKADWTDCEERINELNFRDYVKFTAVKKVFAYTMNRLEQGKIEETIHLLRIYLNHLPLIFEDMSNLMQITLDEIIADDEDYFIAVE